MNICPICKKVYFDYPALSRKDNVTEICSRCALNEALQELDKLKEINRENKEYLQDLEEECENLTEHNRLLVEELKELGNVQI